MSEAYCANHPGVEATGACEDCKKAICNKCTKGTLDGFMCPPCAHKRYGRRKLVTGLKVGGLVALLVGVGVFGLFVVGKGSEKATLPPEPPEASAADVEIQQMRADRDRAPCDQALVRELVKTQNRQEKYAGAIDDAQAHLAKCGDFPRLRWDLLYALQQLERYPEAIKQSTHLITRDPYDSDFWWWRGEDLGKSKQEALAVADYRQSFANSESSSSSRFAAARILDVVEAANQPCEGVAAINFFIDVHGGDVGRSIADKVDELNGTADCATRRGTGTTDLPSLAAGPARVKVTVGATEGRFQLDERCGTTALTQAFAAKAGVAGGGAPLDTIALGAIHSGVPATIAIAIGKAKAPEVAAVIVPTLPDELDGVVCLSLLWQFAIERRDDGGLTLTGV
jgi:hypothetical protein